MFVRKRKNSSNSTSIQIIEGYRCEGKVRHKVIKHVGTSSSEMQIKELMELGAQIKVMLEANIDIDEINIYHQKELSKITSSGGASILNCQKIRTNITGIHKIYGKTFDDLNLQETSGLKKEYYEALKDIVMARISTPSSKRAAVNTLLEDFDIKHSLNTVYRMMDKLDANTIEKIQKMVSKYVINLVGGKINVLFYDVTTIYFESFSPDDLKKLGFSKDNKVNQPQIVLTLLVTDKGLPLGYQVLPGNTYEGHTLITAIEKWKLIYPTSNFVLVADSGMLNKDNLTALDTKGINYIVAARIKSLPKATKEELLAYKAASESDADYYHSINFGDRKLILSYKFSRARKDEYDCNKAIEQLVNKLKISKNPESLINNYGYKKYIKVTGNSTVNLVEEKIEESKRWDGLHGLITNLKSLSPQEAYKQYYNLWQVEDAFRINKSDLKIRPVFHWTPQRIETHILISYLAYSCYKIVEYKVNLNKEEEKYSHREIKAIIKKVKLNIYKDKYSDNYYALPEPVSEDTELIFKTFNVALELDAYCCTYDMNKKIAV